MDATQFMSMGLGELCGRLSDAVQKSPYITAERKKEIAISLGYAGQGLEGKVADLNNYDPIALTDYAGPEPAHPFGDSNGGRADEAGLGSTARRADGESTPVSYETPDTQRAGKKGK
jgi:hypothetical protein